MNAFTVLLFGIVWFLFAYFWYGKVIQKKVLHCDDDNITPSHQFEDGKDFVPSKLSILFGHHFSSIAGAGPIVGPIIAFGLFGWLPAILWILIGSVFIGAVHDYTVLMVSVRNGGRSIVDVSKLVISKKSKAIFGVFVWITLVLIQAVFADLVAKTLVNKPEIVIPTISIIVIAVFFGVSVFKYSLNEYLGVLFALVLLGFSIYLGEEYPIHASEGFWLITTFLYCFIASVLPVQTLLQPRDYLSMYILLIGLAVGIIGIILLQPEINAPAFVAFNSSKGPLFPILFITVACGAISGFHALVSSGTTAKQLNRERDGKRITFGGMLLEGVLAMLVILMISSILIWKGGTEILPEGGMFFQDYLKIGVVIVFGQALGKTVESLGIPLVFGIMFGVLMLKAFILTSLDTATRVNRYIVQETLGISLGISKGSVFRNKYFATSISLIVAYLLCLFDGYEILWPMFGVSNQLIATLALFVVTTYLFGTKAPKFYTLIPGFIMLIITESALVYQAIWVFWPQDSWHLSVLSIFLAVLGVVVAMEAYGKLKSMPKKKTSTV